MLKIIRNITVFTSVYIILGIKFNWINLSLSDIICFMADIGTQLGLGATTVGVGTAVAKTIAKSSLPPIQKAGIVIGSSMLGGLFHSSLSHYNNSRLNNGYLSNPTSNRDPNISKFLDDNIYSPLEGLLINLELTNYVCIYLLIMLVIQLVFKFYFKDNIKFNLTWIFGEKINNSLEFYVNKFIKLNKKVSTLYIWLILVSVIFALSSSIFFIHDINTNLDRYITIYKSMKDK